MIRILHRIAAIALFALLLAGISLNASPAQAQTGNWEYVEALGGYLDWDTGLVWGEYSINVMNPAFYMGWDYVNTNYLPGYRSATGIAAWRMPTVAELQTAGAHGIITTIGVGNPGIPSWSSEQAKVKGVQRAAAVYLFNGAVELRSKAVGAGFIPVYSILPPPPPPPPHPGKGRN